MEKLEEVIHVHTRQGNEVKWLLGHRTAHRDKRAMQRMLPGGNHLKVLIFLNPTKKGTISLLSCVHSQEPIPLSPREL